MISYKDFVHLVPLRGIDCDLKFIFGTGNNGSATTPSNPFTFGDNDSAPQMMHAENVTVKPILFEVIHSPITGTSPIHLQYLKGAEISVKGTRRSNQLLKILRSSSPFSDLTMPTVAMPNFGLSIQFYDPNDDTSILVDFGECTIQDIDPFSFDGGKDHQTEGVRIFARFMKINK